MQSRETNETSNNSSSGKKTILALITLYFCSMLIIEQPPSPPPSKRCSWMLLRWRVQADYLFTPDNYYRPTQPLSRTYIKHIYTKQKKSFDDNWAFYYALKELFNIVFHKLAPFLSLQQHNHYEWKVGVSRPSNEQDIHSTATRFASTVSRVHTSKSIVFHSHVLAIYFNVGIGYSFIFTSDKTKIRYQLMKWWY